MMSTNHHGAIVVGVDGSIHSHEAVRTAARFGRRENRRLHIMHAYHISPTVYPAWGVGVDMNTYLAGLRDAAREVVDEAEHLAHEVVPELEVTTLLTASDAREALVSASRTAHMVVVGSRGLGPVRSMLLGSVSMWLTQHAMCPVLVVRPPVISGAARIVVGADGSELSTAALEYAFSQASIQDVPLTVVHCFSTTFRGGYGLTGRADDDLDDLSGERLAVTESVAGLREKYPDVEATFELRQRAAAAQLVDASRQASLVVVGARRQSATGLFSGSVSRPVIEHSHCSVAVIPADVVET